MIRRNTKYLYSILRFTSKSGSRPKAAYIKRDGSLDTSTILVKAEVPGSSFWQTAMLEVTRHFSWIQNIYAAAKRSNFYLACPRLGIGWWASCLS